MLQKAKQYRLKKLNNILEKKVREKTKDLNLINQNLEKLVDEKSNKLLQQQKLLSEQSKLVAMSEMIGNIAHQWRQPLSVITTAASGIQIQKEYNILTDENFNEAVTVINKNALFLSKTIDNFRDYIKGDLRIVDFNLTEKYNIFLDLVDAKIKKFNIKIIINTDDNINLKGYPNQLIECLIIMFDNSKDAFTQTNKQNNRYIFIDQKIIKNNIIITFKDNAGGIEENIISKIFEPYFTTKFESQGTGLGLNILHKLIVNDMNGSIDVQNTEFIYKITLPFSL